MEQDPKHRPWCGVCAILGITTALCFLLGCVPFKAQESSAVAAGAFSSQSSVRQVIPIGRAVGIKLFSDGVLVVGLSQVETAQGLQQPGKDCGLKTGDLITHINGQDVDTIEEVQSLLVEDNGEPLTIRATRAGKTLQLSATPAANLQGGYQLGVWLRDSMAGIGTMTFYDPDSGVFAALGHGINDIDTAQLMTLESGSIMHATVSDVKKGTVGDPGELHGAFDLKQDLGQLFANTEVGIFGTMSQQVPSLEGQRLDVAASDQVQPGPATILTNIRGDRVEEFQIEITRITQQGEPNRALTIQVTDPALIEATGGIVQGMSGSPILQNGRIVGAVTHVLINDPTRGYGILIETMLDEIGDVDRCQNTA